MQTLKPLVKAPGAGMMALRCGIDAAESLMPESQKTKASDRARSRQNKFVTSVEARCWRCH
jgi:hypothetical protein